MCRHIIKRSGERVLFDESKIFNAISKANREVTVLEKRMSNLDIQNATSAVSKKILEMQRDATVEEIQDLVEDELFNTNKDIFSLYHDYRYLHSERRKMSPLDRKFESITEVSVDENGTIGCNNEEVKGENSNKNPTVLSVQRDYISGEVSRYFSKKYLLPNEIKQADKEGIIHFHDSDFFIHHMHNCDLVNLEDMLQNGTKISGTRIDPPKSFATACTVTSQIVAQVASSQYGGQSISLAHLAPFVDLSRKKTRARLGNALDKIGATLTDKELDDLTEDLLQYEIKSGIQTIQYQLITLQTTNGQSPFVTVFMYLNEVEDGQLRKDMAMLIEEMLLQRIQGVKDETGAYITPAFPKLIYVLQEDNIHEGDKYWYLTELAAKCTAKRLVPDYVSEKVMLELKGDIYPPMGCVDGKSLVDYKIKGTRYVESFERFWKRVSLSNIVKTQSDGVNKYIDAKDIEIYDSKLKGYTPVYRLIQNVQDTWYEVDFTGGRYINVTDDHPFEVEGKGIVLAKDLIKEDKIQRVASDVYKEDYTVDFNRTMWSYGVILCDGCISADRVCVSLGVDEEDIVDNIANEMSSWGYDVNIKLQERGTKGTYYEVVARKSSDLCKKFISLFEGERKVERHIPSEVFNMSREDKLSFLAGIVDSDGYINATGKTQKVQIGSTNEELALQQMYLAIDLGYNASVYKNHYSKKYPEKIRYMVEFNFTKELEDYLVCEKKKVFNTRKRNYDNIVLNSDICSVKRITIHNETKYSYDVTTKSEHFSVNGIYSHNCRSFLTPDRFTDEGKFGNTPNALNYKEGKHKYYGRFNQGVVTINLVDAALSSGGNEDEFWKLMGERLELCHRALRLRHERLLGTPSDVAPILWQDGALARLKSGETIDKLLYNGYSTISLGYAGLAECVRYMKGCSHTEEEGKVFGLRVMQMLNDYCAKWKKNENIDYSVYGTPLESTTYKFAKCLQKRFGIIKGVTDKNYITNSYHIHVTEKINAFDKLAKEAEFQKLSPGGAISYVEVPNMQENIPAVLSLIQFIYDTILYAELNTKSDYCDICGYDKEIDVIKSGGKWIWRCPRCGNTDQTKMHIARRTCGYIGTQYWNQGRTEEIAERVLHL